MKWLTAICLEIVLLALVLMRFRWESKQFAVCDKWLADPSGGNTINHPKYKLIRLSKGGEMWPLAFRIKKHHTINPFIVLGSEPNILEIENNKQEAFYSTRELDWIQQNMEMRIFYF